MTSESEKIWWQGEWIVLRQICDADEAQHKVFMSHLSSEDIRMRFFELRKEWPQQELARLTHLDPAHEIAFIAERLGTPPQLSETLGIVRAVNNDTTHESEFSIIVRSDLKRMGLGSLLLKKMLRHLSQHGTKRIIGDVLRENKHMRQFLQTHGFKLDKLRTNTDALALALHL